jgi:hypothetical protein
MDTAPPPCLTALLEASLVLTFLIATVMMAYMMSAATMQLSLTRAALSLVKGEACDPVKISSKPDGRRRTTPGELGARNV